MRLNTLIDNPNDVLTIKTHQKLNAIAYQTARTDLLELVSQGWLKSMLKGKTFYFIAAGQILDKIQKPI